MTMQSVDYEFVRANAEIGDVIAFGGDSLGSKLIKLFMGANVSHAGAILSSAATAAGQPEIIESTVHVDKKEFTVAVRPLNEVVDAYDGDVWWLPKSDLVPFVAADFDTFLRSKIGDLFDPVQGLGVVLGELVDTFLGREIELMPEDFSSFFCSELVAAGFEAAGTVPPLNSSEVSPKDLCRWAIYEEDYYYVNGGSSGPEIEGYNSVDPSGDSTVFEFASFGEVEEFQNGLPGSSFVIQHERLREGIEFATRSLRDAGELEAMENLQRLLQGEPVPGWS